MDRGQNVVATSSCWEVTGFRKAMRSRNYGNCLLNRYRGIFNTTALLWFPIRIRVVDSTATLSEDEYENVSEQMIISRLSMVWCNKIWNKAYCRWWEITMRAVKSLTTHFYYVHSRTCHILEEIIWKNTRSKYLLCKTDLTLHNYLFLLYCPK